MGAGATGSITGAATTVVSPVVIVLKILILYEILTGWYIL
jgi:hypothetical protein